MFNTVLSAIESLFPLLPMKTPFQVSVEGNKWLPDAAYYFIEGLDIDDPRYRQRIRAVLTLDRNAVSFWRRREQRRQVALRFRNRLREHGLRVTDWEYPW